MKLVVAYIQPHKLQDVKQSLYKAEVFKMSVTNALGCGEQKGYSESYRGVEFEVNLLKKVRIEIAVNEEFVEKTINAIVEAVRVVLERTPPELSADIVDKGIDCNREYSKS